MREVNVLLVLMIPSALSLCPWDWHGCRSVVVLVLRTVYVYTRVRGRIKLVRIQLELRANIFIQYLPLNSKSVTAVLKYILVTLGSQLGGFETVAGGVGRGLGSHKSTGAPLPRRQYAEDCPNG